MKNRILGDLSADLAKEMDICFSRSLTTVRRVEERKRLKKREERRKNSKDVNTLTNYSMIQGKVIQTTAYVAQRKISCSRARD